MPIIVPEEQSVDLQGLNLQGAQPLEDSGLGSIARGANIAGEQLAAAQLAMQRKRNATKFFEATVALGDAYRTAETENLQRTGSAAFGVTDDIEKWWESEPHKLMDGLENEAQRELFAQEVARRRETSLNTFSRFQAQETNRAAIESTQASIDLETDTGAANFADTEARGEALDMLKQKAGLLADFNNFPPGSAEAERLMLDATTKFHQQVIENMVDGDPEAANAYFEEHRSEISGSVHDTLLGEIETGNDIAAAQRTADDIWARGLGEQEALAAARKETSGEQREQALRLLRQQYQEQKQVVAENRANTVDRAWEQFNEGGLAGMPASMVAELQRVAPQTLTAMNARQWTPQDAIVTNWDVYYGTLDLASSDRALFADLDLRQMAGDLNTRELTVLQKIQADINGDRASPTATLTQILGEVPWESKERERRGLFERTVREAVTAEQQKLARELTGAEIRDIVDRQLLEVTVPRSFWFDKSKPFFETTPEERDRLRVEYDSIPQVDRQELEADLRDAGQDASPETVARIYREWLIEGN